MTSQYWADAPTHSAMKPLMLGGGNKSCIDINQCVENEQFLLPTTQDLYTALLGSKV